MSFGSTRGASRTETGFPVERVERASRRGDRVATEKTQEPCLARRKREVMARMAEPRGSRNRRQA